MLHLTGLGGLFHEIPIAPLKHKRKENFQTKIYIGNTVVKLIDLCLKEVIF